jgi:nucleoside 2-deoxyribosyltransferase
MLIYVAGPIRPIRGRTVTENIDIAKGIALELWKAGHAVICPHANTDLPYSLAEKECEENIWLQGDLVMIARCDAMVIVPDWQGSKGTQGEIEFAEARGIPIYYYPDVPKPHPTEVKSPIQSRGFIDIIMKMYRVHLNKNADYSPANILGTGEIGLATRLWDKVTRLMNLTGFRIDIQGSIYDQPKTPKQESIDDTYMDLSVYGIIGMLYRSGRWGK